MVTIGVIITGIIMVVIQDLITGIDGVAVTMAGTILVMVITMDTVITMVIIMAIIKVIGMVIGMVSTTTIIITGMVVISRLMYMVHECL